MEVVAQRFEDPELKALHDAGEDVSWAGEFVYFRENDSEYRFDIDDSMPGEAVFARITEAGRETSVKLTRPQGSRVRELPRGALLLRQAVQWLRDLRGVRQIAVYDGEFGFYRRIPVEELANPTHGPSVGTT